MLHDLNKKTGASLALALLLTACATAPAPVPAAAPAAAPATPAAPVPPAPRELTILSINDFHGNIQPKSPTPLMPRLPDPQTGELKAQPAGGIAFFAAALAKLRAERPGAVLVAGGDFIGASPQYSALLKDEPTLAAFAQLEVTASALGNHELDAGLQELLRKQRGDCPAEGCVWPGYKGAGFPFLGANVVDAKTGKPMLPTHVIKEVAGFKVAFVGAATRETPSVSLARNVAGMRFLDEAEALNALIPQLRAEGAQVLIAVMHEGALFNGGANDKSYACEGLRGRGIDIAKRLDPAYAMIVGGHTHNAYTCKINGRLLVQAGSFGGWITESRLTIDAQGKVLAADAVNHPVLQSAYVPNPAFVALVQRASELTAAARNRPVATISQGAVRVPKAPHGDAPLGNLIGDAMLAYAKKRGPADIALMNQGGIRTDLTVEPGRPVTMSELLAIQPFGNELVAVTITGAQLRDLLTRGLPKGDASPRMNQVSSSLRYTWSQGADGVSRLGEVKVDGKPLDDARDYRIVANSFMADGGDGNAPLRQGRDRAVLGLDIDAFVELLSDKPEAVNQVQPGRILRMP